MTDREKPQTSQSESGASITDTLWSGQVSGVNASIT
jgi:hypothetical protein